MSYLCSCGAIDCPFGDCIITEVERANLVSAGIPVLVVNNGESGAVLAYDAGNYSQQRWEEYANYKSQ